jgi:hypothetical protein
MRSKLAISFSVIALLLFGFWNQHGKASTDNGSSYEYHVLFDTPMNGNAKALNEYGAQGWELVGVAPNESNGTIKLYLKRPRKSG